MNVVSSILAKMLDTHWKNAYRLTQKKAVGKGFLFQRMYYYATYKTIITYINYSLVLIDNEDNEASFGTKYLTKYSRVSGLTFLHAF